jgi:hypothetical protein
LICVAVVALANKEGFNFRLGDEGVHCDAVLKQRWWLMGETNFRTGWKW